MTEILNLLAFLFLALPLSLYTGFIVVMRLKHKRDRRGLKWWEKLYGYPTLVVAYSLDVVVNLIPMSVIFLEFPRELTVTQRLGRILRTSDSRWRVDLAKLLEEIIEWHDPGHIKS